jgi:hypothetical protein
MCEITELPKTRKFIATVTTSDTFEIEIDGNLDPKIIKQFEKHFGNIAEDKIEDLAKTIAMFTPNNSEQKYEGIGYIQVDDNIPKKAVKGIRVNVIELDDTEIELKEKE